MTSPAKVLAKEFSVETNLFVDRIRRDGQKWLISEREGEGRQLQADHLVMTIPSVQLLELFERKSLLIG